MHIHFIQLDDKKKGTFTNVGKFQVNLLVDGTSVISDDQVLTLDLPVIIATSSEDHEQVCRTYSLI